MNNGLNKKSSALSLTGIALIGIAAANIILLIINVLMPIIDGSLMAELLPGAEAEVITLVTILFGVILAVEFVSYLLMALLGKNAINIAKDPCGIKARKGLAKFIIFIGVLSLIASIPALDKDISFMENFSILFPALAQLSLAAAYFKDVKAAREEAKLYS